MSRQRIHPVLTVLFTLPLPEVAVIKATPTMQYRSLKEDAVTVGGGKSQHGTHNGGSQADIIDDKYGGGNQRTPQRKGNDETSTVSGLYLNRFMDPKVIVQSLYDAATAPSTTIMPDASSGSNANACSSTSQRGNISEKAGGRIIPEKDDDEKVDSNGEESAADTSSSHCEKETKTPNDLSDIRQLVVDGVDLQNASIRNAFIYLFEMCDHDWYCIEFKGCLGPLDTIIRALLSHGATTAPKSTSGHTRQNSAKANVDPEERQRTEEEDNRKQESPPVVKTRIRTIYHLRIIGVALDEKLAGAIADLLSVNGDACSSQKPASDQSNTATIENTRNVTTKTSYHVCKLMISGTKVMGVNVMALRHGWHGANASRSTLLESFDAIPSSTQPVGKKISGATGIDWESCQSLNQGRFLTKLDIFSCDLSDELVANLVKTIQHARHPIQELDLGKNQCVFHGLRALDDMLCDQNSTIKWLNLFYQRQGQSQRNRDDTTRNSDDQHTIRGQELQQRRQQLQQSDLFDVSLISNGLATNKSLITLILRGNQLSDDCVDSLASAVQQNSTLQKLNMTDCCISRKAIQAFIPKVLGCPISATSSQLQMEKPSTLSISSSSSFSQIQKLWLDGGQRFGRDSSGGRVAARKEVLQWFQTALQCNDVLEELFLPFGYFEDRKNSNQITHLLDLNRGGRKLITTSLLPLPVAAATTASGGDDGKNDEVYAHGYQKYRHRHVPIALWPHVLERVDTIPLFMSGLRHQHKNKEEQSNVGCRRISVMYSFLRSHVLLQS